MKHFPHIAGLAEGLSVLTNAHPSAHHWNNVVKNQVINRVAPKATSGLPIISLPRREVSSVTKFFAGFVGTGNVGKHLISIETPSLFQSGGNLGSSFWRMLGTLRRAALSSRLSRWISCNLRQGLRTVIFAPERVISTAHGLALTFGFTAGFGNSTSNVRWATVEAFSTSNALKLLTGSSWHCASCDNRVNSVDISKYHIRGLETILSQAAHVTIHNGLPGARKVQRLGSDERILCPRAPDAKAMI